MGVFSEHALEYGAHGLRVFPVHVFQESDGWKKKPAIGGWRKAACPKPTGLMRNFPDAQIGILNDNLTVVDVDDPKELDWSIQEFGDSPIIVQTPGGFHLYYKPGGEHRSVRYQGKNGRLIDVLGTGGYVVAPPSSRPDGASWQFLRGSIDDLGNLPNIRPGVLPNRAAKAQLIPEGSRNNTLLVICLRDLKDGWEPEIIPARALAWNESVCDPPQSENEVMSTVKSAIRMHSEGKNFVGGSGVVQTTRADFEAFNGNADALMLYSKLKLEHGSRNEPFSLDVRAMSQANVIPGWGERRIRNARTALLELGRIEKRHQGRGRGNPSIYGLDIKGAQTSRNITRQVVGVSGGGE